MAQKLKLFSGNSNLPLAEEVCDYLDIPLGQISVSTFSDGEVSVRIEENVRGSNVFIIQSTCNPVNTHVMELLIMMDAFRRASAREITAVIPYYGYGRQDRKDQPRVPISAKLMADLIVTAGAHRVVTLDLHAGQTQGFFNIPVDHIYAAPVLLDYFKKATFHDLVVVSPDAGGVERARAFAKRIEASLAIIDKRREGPSRIKVMNVVGDVKDRDVLILDDMIDTAGTLLQAAVAIQKCGARKIIAACTHPILSGSSIENLKNAPLDAIVVTNTVPLQGKEALCNKIVTLSVATLLGEAIRRIHEEASVSSLFV